MDLVGYLKIDPILLLKELARTVKSGSVICILNWSSQMLLPGYPVLEARLNETSLGRNLCLIKTEKIIYGGYQNYYCALYEENNLGEG